MMTEPLPDTKRLVKSVPLLIFAGNARDAYRYAREHGYRVDEWAFVDHPRRIMGIDASRFFVVKVGAWNLNFNASQAWGLYLERLRRNGGKLRELGLVGPHRSARNG